MILKKLYINETINCPFHPGLNIILGRNYVTPKANEGNENMFTDTNGIGKTLIVQLTKYVLKGSVGSTFTSDYFQNNKLWIHLFVEKNDQPIVLIRPAFDELKDKVVIVYNGELDNHLAELEESNFDWSQMTDLKSCSDFFNKIEGYSVYTTEEYQKYINKVEGIDYSKSNLNFSSLLDYIVRDEKLGFSDTVSLPQRTAWVQHRIIQYLFGVPYHLEQNLRDLSDEIAEKKVEKSAKIKQLKERKITNIDSLENLKQQVQSKIKDIQLNIKSMKLDGSLEEVRLQYSSLKKDSNQVNSEITKRERYTQNYQTIISDLKSKEKSLKSLLQIDEFYEDLLGFFPDQVKDNIEKYKEFFESVADDRKNYYKDLINKLKGEIRTLRLSSDSLSSQLNILALKFKNTDILTDISLLISKEEELKNELKTLDGLKGVLVESENLDDEIETLIGKQKELIKEGKDHEKNNRNKRTKIIELFHKFLREIYHSPDGTLEFNFINKISVSNSGRTEVNCSIPSQESHGRSYARINLFDLMWFLRSRDASEYDPEFLIHDGSYVKISPSVKSAMLNSIINRIGQKQYIITLNEGEMADLNNYKDYINIELDGSSMEGKFFGEQF